MREALLRGNEAIWAELEELYGQAFERGAGAKQVERLAWRGSGVRYAP